MYQGWQVCKGTPLVADFRNSFENKIAMTPWWKSKYVLGAAGLFLLLLVYGAFTGNDGEVATTVNTSQNVPAVPQPEIGSRPPRNATEAIGRDLEALQQLSRAYDLSPEQERAIRDIIESANNSP